MRLLEGVERRIAAKILPVTETGCWLWTASCMRDGYAQININGKRYLAHRVLYEHTFGAVPSGLCLDHKCEVKCCVNPDHLEPVTQGQNVLRAARSLFLANCRKHQKQAQEFTAKYKNRKYQELRRKRGWSEKLDREKGAAA